jgi:hypothetical protein
LAERITGIELDADVFSTWAAVGPDLRAVLRCDGGYIFCQELRRNFRQWRHEKNRHHVESFDAGAISFQSRPFPARP